VQDHVSKSHGVGTTQYIEWLILINRVQPSLIAGVSTETLATGTIVPAAVTYSYYYLLLVLVLLLELEKKKNLVRCHPV
jgi:hypothetical protein